MAIKFVSIKCPECGASLDIEEGRTQIFCSYCGTKVMVQNDNEYIFRHIDEAGIKQAEYDRAVRLKELELEENQAHRNDRLRNILMKIWIPASIIIVVLGIGIMFFGGEMGPIYGFDFLAFVGGPIVGGGAALIFKVLPEKEAEKGLLRNGGIKLPKSIFPYSEKNYEVVASELRNAGFNNVSCVNMHDLTLGLLQKPGKVDSISVNGENVTSGGKVYMPNVVITIYYHGR
jgi:DNA-directed RNA polymerase subunit RPC12/RpoP